MGVFSSFPQKKEVAHLMKTNIDYVVLTEIDEFNQPHKVPVRVRDKDNRLMVDRMIKVLSQNPKDAISYDKALENEVFHDFHERLQEGLSIIVALHDEQVTKEYFDAIYGVKRDAKNPYLTFAKCQVAASTDNISGNNTPSEETIELQQKMADMMKESNGLDLIEQALRARRRLCNFNKRYREKVN